ncbi:hypothetical protein BC830DRAFT_1151506 [Chytriomyces sp. MP71]|nr:hypothetical protein BC830DRAFT_1151506 [Chytriomyces sp. MP71]
MRRGCKCILIPCTFALLRQSLSQAQYFNRESNLPTVSSQQNLTTQKVSSQSAALTNLHRFHHTLQPRLRRHADFFHSRTVPPRRISSATQEAPRTPH